MLSAALIQIMYIVCLYSSRLLGMFIRSAQEMEPSVYEVEVYNSGF